MEGEAMPGPDDLEEAREAILRSRLLPSPVLRRLRHFPRALDAAALAFAHIDRPVRFQTIAAQAAMTPCAFSRFFATKIGITFSALLRLLRMERAAEQLAAYDRTISDVAERTGYQSCCTFSRAFKDVVGETPSEYRRRFLFEEAVTA
jgi:transcriptional regulator GlxA family with amidase domain